MTPAQGNTLASRHAASLRSLTFVISFNDSLHAARTVSSRYYNSQGSILLVGPLPAEHGKAMTHFGRSYS